MTRRLALVNLSNWDGEDYEIADTKTYAGKARTDKSKDTSSWGVY